VQKVEAEITSGAPLEIPEVPAILGLPQEAGDGKLATAADAAADAAEVPQPDAVARHNDTATDSGA
jgi:hypothetical protein